MTITAHVQQVYIAATPEQVWRAITDSEWTQRFDSCTGALTTPPSPPATA